LAAVLLVAADARSVPVAAKAKLEVAPKAPVPAVAAKAKEAKPVAAKAAVPVKAVAVAAKAAAPVKAVAVAAKAPAAPPAKAKVASLVHTAPLNPPLKDVKSDKKFFGPPFPADYPQDSRPVVQKGILDKLKGPEQPYPALQSKKDFDADYVKDENADKGAWKAQFEYDALRRKLVKEEADKRAAEGHAKKEGADVDDAQKKSDAAGKDVDDAKKGADAASKKGSEDGAKEGAADGDALPPSAENLEKLKKQVADAEEAYEKEKKDFAECERQLQEAKDLIAELKAQQADMEKKLDGDTKLWAETKTVKLNLKAARKETAHAKRAAAEARLKVAQNTKADFDAVLAKERAESDAAKANLQKETNELDQAKKDMAKATLRLQKLRGYTPEEKAAMKSGSSHMKAVFPFLAMVAMQALL